MSDLLQAAAKADSGMVERARQLFSLLFKLDESDRIETINAIRRELHQYSPFSAEPVDCVVWVPADSVVANDYNPNSVAPPEMQLLEHSIEQDGYTQPIVAFRNDDAFEVVDGFHRNRVGKESATVRTRTRGYLPLTIINEARADRGDRIAATIRHNRARGKHKVEAMSDIVVELKRRNWTDEKIGRELGMEPDEVLRLCQITGLAELFSNQDFSHAWDIDDSSPEAEELLSDIDEDYVSKTPDRIFHTWENWECYRAGFYEERPPNNMTQDDGEREYEKFLRDLPLFEVALKAVTSEWRNSCEHYLTNDRMNRVAWLGQASVAQALGLPSCCRGGYHRLTNEEKYSADQLALRYLNTWLEAAGRSQVMLADAVGKTEMELY